MNSQSDSRSRLYPKYSFGSGASSGGFASFPSPFFSGSMTRLKPVPTGSTKTRSVKASHDDSFSTSRAGIAGNVPSDGKSTRCGPTAPMCRYAEEAPGPPLKTKVTGRPPSSPPATYETEKISAAGFSFLRRTLHFAVAVYWIAFLPRPHVAVVSAPAGGSWSGLSSLLSFFVSSLMGAHATDWDVTRVAMTGPQSPQ